MNAVPATAENIRRAAEILRSGGLVVMPTETVYGLACDARNEAAAERVFALKKRPQDNPIIVHVSGREMLENVVTSYDRRAEILIERFWPGPLTLILPRSPAIASRVTAGLDTVAVRMPEHPVALALIRALDGPIAAPSANRFMGLSATRVEDLDPVIAEAVEIVLDGGPCRVGLESTVVDLTEPTPRILRPGGISRGDIQAALGSPLGSTPPSGPRRSPGLYRRHYAPESPVVLQGTPLEPHQRGLTFGRPAGKHQVRMPRDPAAYAALLYHVLHELDLAEKTPIYVELPPEGPEWEAVLDRLYRAGQSETFDPASPEP